MAEVFSDVRVKRYKGGADYDTNLLGFAKVTVADAVVLTGIKILKGEEGNFIGMPTRMFERNGDIEYKEIFYPLYKEVRRRLQDMVLREYDKAVAGQGRQDQD